jgi:hypothetical protein
VTHAFLQASSLKPQAYQHQKRRAVDRPFGLSAIRAIHFPAETLWVPPFGIGPDSPDRIAACHRNLEETSWFKVTGNTYVSMMGTLD